MDLCCKMAKLDKFSKTWVSLSISTNLLFTRDPEIKCTGQDIAKYLCHICLDKRSLFYSCLSNISQYCTFPKVVGPVALLPIL